MSTLSQNNDRSARTAGLVAFVFAGILAGAAILAIDQSAISARKALATIDVAEQAGAVEVSVDRAMSATYALAAMVKQGGGGIDDFDSVAAKLLLYYPGVQSLQLAPDGVVRQIYPLAGNEGAIGHNLFADPQRNKESLLAKETGRLTLAGPFKLVQGGYGAAGRLPVYLAPDAQSPPAFWGFAIALIRFPDVLGENGLSRLKAKSYQYQLWKKNPNTGGVQIIAASEGVGAQLVDPVEHPLATPNGTWYFSVAPDGGWRNGEVTAAHSMLGLLISLLIGWVAKQMVELRNNRLVLSRLVDERTNELSKEVTDRRLAQNLASNFALQSAAILDTASDGIHILDSTGLLVNANRAFLDLLGLGKDAIGTLHVFDWDAKDDWATIKSRNDALIETGGTRVFETRHRRSDGHVIDVEINAGGSTIDGKGFLYAASRDITERKAAEANLQLAASVFAYAREGIMITDGRGMIVDVNESFTRITGYSRAEALGNNPRMLSSGRHDPAFYADLWGALNAQGHWTGEIWNRRRNGEVYAEMLTISAVRDDQGAVGQYVALFSDISAIKAHQEQLEHIAHFDSLTHLPNRLLLADRLQQTMAQTLRRGTRLAVVYLDLDGFKSVNDTHGHDLGDQLLIAVASAMKGTLREGDTLGRIGGDEFVAILIDLGSVESCVPLLERLVGAASTPVQLGEHRMQISASVGVTIFPQEEELEAEQLLRQADQAMYQAKLAGKNRYHIFDPTHDSSIRGHHENLERIRHALERHEFVLHYQPKVDMRTGKVVGVEALVRWQHPEKGLLAPATFLPVIEEHPVAIELGEWVIESALEQIQEWQKLGLNFPVSVNVGASQLQQDDFVKRLQLILEKHPLVNPSMLELEVLETSALEDISQVSQVIEECRKFGIQFALDDFGTGYSSLTYLKRLRVALLKIDQSFVRDMLIDVDDLAILKGVIGLAGAFRCKVIAEGVETTEIGTALLQLGCDLAQGYGIAMPMPADKIPAWVATWKPDAAWSDASTQLFSRV